MIHILRSNNTARPWWPADQRLDLPADQRIWCDCCNAYSPASEAEARLLTVELPIGGAGSYGEGRSFYDFLSYCDEPELQTRCASGFGCTTKPRRRASAHLRRREY